MLVVQQSGLFRVALTRHCSQVVTKSISNLFKHAERIMQDSKNKNIFWKNFFDHIFDKNCTIKFIFVKKQKHTNQLPGFAIRLRVYQCRVKLMSFKIIYGLIE